MSKSSSVAELQPSPRAERTEGRSAPRAERTEGRPRKRAPGALERRAKAVASELSELPIKPLLIGAGIGAALFGSMMAVSSKRRGLALPLTGLNQALTKTALVAVARVVSGQAVRSVATSALMDVAEAMKTR